MKEYDHKEIEAKWQKFWSEQNTFRAENASPKPKYYSLVEFPYPSGDGLHVGHPRPYIGMDIVSRKRRAEGFNVLYPMGWDAFGLPTENFAIKTGKDPRIVTKENSDTFREQIQSLGISFDWSREVNTTDPTYYKWTQWLFLQFLKHDLAYKKKMEINWCPKDKIGLANEEVINGCCERCGTAVEKREKEQWMLAITKYADRLDKDLDDVNFLEKIKLQQRNWIGKSEGAEIDFELITNNSKLTTVKVFTTRPDTIFGATFIAVSAETAKSWLDFGFEANEETRAYVSSILGDRLKKDFEIKEKTGVSAGFSAINPASKQEIPVWIVNYVLGDVGTGAIMGVPADDERDRAFAEKYGIPIVTDYKKAGFEDYGKRITRFKLRDWVFSRQRYWGEPIPVIHCEKCGMVPVPEADLPVLLPHVSSYEPTDSGESPLASIAEWVNVKCPTCGADAKRETDTMPNWAGSSWYFLRYTDPQNNEVFASEDALKYWMQVDWYNGGMEHTTLHLLYSRFWNKFLFDIGLVPFSEPYKKRTSHGLILAEGGEKMSKSKGNVINPNDIVRLYGADTLRLYEMFMGPFDQPVGWSTESIIGPRRFIERVWRLGQKVTQTRKTENAVELQPILNKTIQKVSDDIETMGFNTAISSMMIFLNEAEKHAPSSSQFEAFIRLLSPFAPHLCEELWSMFGNTTSVSFAPWPIIDTSSVGKSSATFAVQVNGKVRGTFSDDSGLDEASAVARAQSLPEVQKWVGDSPVKRVIFVKGRLVNIVI